jgi:formiminotetrahydrofolate cyclodeaminase
MPAPDLEGSLDQWLRAIAGPTPAPAGGAVAAIAAALSAALTGMVSGLTGSRARYAAAHDAAARVRARAEELRGEFVTLAIRDTAVFGEFARALEMPKGTEAERASRALARADALRQGADVQLDLLERVAEAADLALVMAHQGLASALGDVATGVFLAAAAARSAYWAARSNLAGLGDDGGRLERGLEVLQRIETAEREILGLLAERVP